MHRTAAWNYSSCEQCASRHECMFVVYSDMSICMSDNATRDSEVLLLIKYLNLKNVPVVESLK